ncbi:ABC-type tungstate transport system permease component-like protein [Kribbella flavida DSM 17836]|uniref:ABC-type tungstate transport system permease component-like protein n=1 Tax=Kribbella flavida (strain DSM 17836 / JCM 10339 / NBRC 14399) TaxID=479435 RepID=D2PS79_KRIFD|nr:substrate-binding domain-containing protein [Kribbella flavida]ADB31203.1 ABC-type tungstate transport system permease component-like protein [Kribbella flavida DSM 17836]
MRRVVCLLAAVVVTGCSGGTAAVSSGPSGSFVLATTTSTQDSGLLDDLLPAFDEVSDCAVKTVAVGSGQAMKMGEKGDADVLLVHSPAAEQKFMAAGHGASREPVMHNDFVVVGPPADPAGLAGSAPGTAAAALKRIADRQAPFASRADDSGTHAKELALWKAAGVKPSGRWYVETGQGMGATLTIANQKQAYTLADRGTFLATKGLRTKVLFEDSADLRNDYHVIVVDHEGVNTGCATEFAGWVRQAPAQQLIAKYGEDRFGEPLFFADAGR